MADEIQEAKDKHLEAMKYLQNMRDDVLGIIKDTIDRHYDSPPESLQGEQDERNKLKQDLREAQARIERTINGL
ncbi:MAG: hypothetical protein WDN47_03810 [Candidatus Doudnabacteria bacterium]